MGFFGTHEGAVSLTFDDTIRSQLDHAFPVLNGFGVRGTFYFVAGAKDFWGGAYRWRDLAGYGHEIGNHTASHISEAHCEPENIHQEGRWLETETLESIEKDIMEAQERLKAFAPRQTEWTFAYPCYQTHVGFGGSRQSYVPVIEKRFLAGRGGGSDPRYNDPAYCNLALLAAVTARNMRAEQLIHLVNAAARRRSWLILVFHNVGLGECRVETGDFAKLVSYLADHQDDIWVAPVVEVAQKIQNTREAQ